MITLGKATQLKYKNSGQFKFTNSDFKFRKEVGFVSFLEQYIGIFDGLVHYYKFDSPNTGSNLVDYVNQKNLIPTGSVGFDTTIFANNSASYIYNSLDVDADWGSSYNNDSNKRSIEDYGAKTFSWWHYNVQQNDDEQGTIFKMGDLDVVAIQPTPRTLRLFYSTTDQLHLHNYFRDTMYHYVLVLPESASSSDIKFYINGVSSPPTIELDSSQSYQIDSSQFQISKSGSTNYFIMDEFGIWDRELSETEISILYYSGSLGLSEGAISLPLEKYSQYTQIS